MNLFGNFSPLCGGPHKEIPSCRSSQLRNHDEVCCLICPKGLFPAERGILRAVRSSFRISLNSPHCTEVHFASLFSCWFITAIVVNPPERKLAKRTSVQCCSKSTSSSFSSGFKARTFFANSQNVAVHFYLLFNFAILFMVPPFFPTLSKASTELKELHKAVAASA